MTWVKPPVSFWIISVVSLLWNSLGAVDYYFNTTHNAAYEAYFWMDQLDYFPSRPVGLHMAWAIGAWCALLGSILLLMRQQFAFHVFCLSAVGIILFSIGPGLQDGSYSHQFSVWIGEPLIYIMWIIAIALPLYARRMQARGVLR